MDYRKLEEVYEFHRNMRRTPWDKLFPHWYDTSDALLKSIGDEVERIKAIAIFALLNAGIKPPVLLWQESVEHKKYNADFHISELPHQIKIQAPLYKTWGKITLTNNTKKDIDGLEIKFDDKHGIIINQIITQSDKIVIDITNDKVYINNNSVYFQKIDKGIPYFVTSRNRHTYDESTPLHNEIIRIQFATYDEAITEFDIDVNIQLDNVVFTNEQNIEITGLEAVPIERVELYVKYDFPYNQEYNGWHKVFEKKYDKDTNVIYDMITRQYYTKEFYVDVWFKSLQYPYKVGFPCYKDADEDSMYHVNNRLDGWGEQLGLLRRIYKTEIEENEYQNTYPIYYPFDIEQDYWYYRRLSHEYAWNDLCINDVDIKDTEGHDVIRLYSINPFVEDFVVHAKSQYPKDRDFINHNYFEPITVQQQHAPDIGIQTEFNDIVNILLTNERSTSITLNNYTDNNDVIYKRPVDYHKSVKYIKSSTHRSTELMTYFDLSYLPDNINIDNIEVIVEADSTDNKTNKYSTEETGIIIPGYNGDELFIPLTQDKDYQLKKQSITFANNDLSNYLNKYKIIDENIIHECTIGEFEGQIFDFIKIPFKLKENEEDVDDITDVWVYYDNNVRQASFKKENGKQYIYAYVPNIIATKMTIICKSETHKPFTTTIDIRRVNKYNEENTDVEYQYIEGPLLDGHKSSIIETTEWHTNDIRNLIQKQGVYFRNVIKNTDQQSSTTVHLYNAKLKVTYSQKISDFKITTYIDRTKAEEPNIGKYIVTIKNIGEKTLNTNIDVVTPPNIKLTQSTIPVELKIGEETTVEIDIIATYPISDGYYDIITICEDKTVYNSIEIISDGLIQTGIRLDPHHGKYDDVITLKAEMFAVDGSIIDNEEIEFYINGYKVGKGQKAIVRNNKVVFDISPGDYKFTGTGNLPLEAKFVGSTKYASSTKKSTIFISKDDTRIKLTANQTAPYKGSIELQAKVEYLSNRQYIPVDAGAVEFYIDDEIFLVSSAPSINGTFIGVVDTIENQPGKYTLTARYYGTTKYSATEISQPIEIIGGDAKVTVYDIKVKPQDTTTLRARVTDINNKNIINGYVDFAVIDQDGNNIDFDIENFEELITNVPVKNGVATTPSFIAKLMKANIGSETYTITARYHNTISDNEEEIYGIGENTGFMIIEKGNVQIICEKTFGTQYEPLGIYVKVIGENTNEEDTESETPITTGKVKVSLSKDQIEVEKDLDENGVACILYNPLVFTAKEWAELEKIELEIDANGDLWDRYSGTETRPVSIDFYYNVNEGNLYWISEKDTNEEVIYITDGNLYARTTEDYFRQYTIGEQDIQIEYISNGQYNNKTEIIQNGINITQPTHNINLEIQTYDLKSTNTDNIYCYVTRHDSSNPAPTSNNPVTYGKVQFTIDNQPIGSPIAIPSEDIGDIKAGIAQLDNEDFKTIEYGEHLLKVEFISVNNYRYGYISYALLNITKDKPRINIRVDREVPGKNTDVFVDLTTLYSASVALYGKVDLYLNDTLIGSQYLNGNEGIVGIVNPDNITIPTPEEYITSTLAYNVVMPDDINIPDKYQLKAIYRGNDYFNAASTRYSILAQPSNVTINTKDTIYVGNQEQALLNVEVTCYDDEINEGELILRFGAEEIAKTNVVDNKGKLAWIPNESGDYDLSYENATSYNNKTITINVNVIEPLNEVSIPDDLHNIYTIEDALMCIDSNIDNVIYVNEDVILTQSMEIDKDCTIIGNNNIAIIKDVSNLVVNLEDIPITESYDKLIHEIKDLSITNLNTTDFTIIDKQIYIKTQTEYIPIYLAENGKFYSERKLQLNQILSTINFTINENINANINNIVFKSNDSNSISDFAIYNKGNCTITHSIIHSTTKIINKGTLTAHQNLIYGQCFGEADLDNNWWGTNTPPYVVNNHMIIKIYPIDTPAVISEEVKLIGEMIGANGQKYDMPTVEFSLTADTGYFSIDNGFLTNNKMRSTYLDAEQEGNIFFTVDNETVSCPVYSYERKTEVIIDDIEEALINYQMPIMAKVQSCADIYYEFDDDNNINKSTTLIDEGYMTFFIDEQEVGRTKVKMGEAKTLIFFKDTIYNVGDTYNLTVKYHSSDNYFDSKATIPIKIIDEDNICFVSPLGSDDGDGTYGNPKATINEAITLNKEYIYLLNGEYTESQILITHNVNIKKYNGKVTFKNITNNYIFNIFKDNVVNIYGIDFIENTTNRIFYNGGTLHVEKCIFYKNKGILFQNKKEIDDEQSNLSQTVDVLLSAIVDNRLIANDMNDKSFTYCWFGTNDPEDFNNYIIMDVESSKSVIYIGTLAHVTAKLDYYEKIENGVKQRYKLNDDRKLPLRIAKFATDVGSAKPLKDYTYNRRSTSLINTIDKSNTEQIIISLENNIFYDAHNVDLIFHITDVFDNYVNNKNTFKIHIFNENSIDIVKNIKNTNGKVKCSLPPLSIGEYTIECSYIYNNKTYTYNTIITVNPLQIIISNLDIGNDTHLYYMDIHGLVTDNFNNNINNEEISISIDNNYITKTLIQNGELNKTIMYPLLEKGQHVLTLENTASQKYGTLNHQTKFIVEPEKTHIVFDYDSFEVNVPNTLIVEINDSNGREVQTGKIRVEIDDNNAFENIPVSNGIAILENVIFNKEGQHSIVIYYTDENKHYKDSIKVCNNIGVGIYHVLMSITDSDIVTANIGKKFNLGLTVQDIAYQKVNGGIINIYIDDGLYLENNPVRNGSVNIVESLPSNITSGHHKLTIEYLNYGKYLDTYVYTSLNIDKISTNISINNVTGASGQQTTMNYNIDSAYGIVNTGKLTAYYEGQVIGESIVTDSIINQITMSLPLIPAGNDYDILFTYHDNDNNYQDDSKTVKLNITKSNVIMIPQKTWYYPQRNFNFVIDVRNKEEKIINNGTIDLYIDGVKEHSNIQIVNGQAVIPLFFNNARTYHLNIVYQEDDYYLQTNLEQPFSVNNLKIDDITFSTELSSLPQQTFSTELIFETLDNYNVTDGIVDILFDDNYLVQYNITNNNKYIDFDIEDIPKGEHKLTLNYHDSSIFADFSKDYTFTVQAKTVQMRINKGLDNESQDIVANSNDIITIDTSFGNIVEDEWVNCNISGLIKYYLEVPIYRFGEFEEYINDYDSKFIGLEEIENTSSILHQYTLSTDLLEYAMENYETHYRIKVHFLGNDEYEECEEYINLNIHKQSTRFILLTEEYPYQSEASIRIRIVDSQNRKITGTHTVSIYIDGEFIDTHTFSNGDTLTNNNNFIYQLHSKYTAGQHRLHVIFDGSAIYHPCEGGVNFTITPFVPIIQNDNIEGYIGGDVILDNIILSANNVIIENGELTYNINGEEIVCQPNVPHTIQLSNTEDFDISVRYDSSNLNKYDNFDKTISVHMIKNPIQLSLAAPEISYRGVPFDITLTGVAPTTNIPINLTFRANNNTFEMEDGTISTSITYPFDIDYEPIIEISIETDGDEVFESASIPLIMRLKNQDIVTYDTTQPQSATNAWTLEKALDLVSDYGIIQINNSLSNKPITELTKNVTIEATKDEQGNYKDIRLKNCPIVNTNKQLKIKGLTFKETSGVCIDNEGTLEVTDCQFNSNTDTAIKANGIVTIDHCSFTNNRATNGGCINIGKVNYKITITNCTFNNNRASLYGGCIYSDKVNNMEISNNQFSDLNDATNGGSCIYAHGKINFSSNTFFNNRGRNQIQLLTGTIGMENNLFDGKIQSVAIQQDNTIIDADFNYWGYNDITDIRSHNDNIDITQYLTAYCEFYTKEINNVDEKFVIGRINQYINRLETETTTINILEKYFPVIVDNYEHTINEEINIQENSTIQIGQNTFPVVNE